MFNKKVKDAKNNFENLSGSADTPKQDIITITNDKRKWYFVIAVSFLLFVAIGIVGVVVGVLSLESVTNRDSFVTVSGEITEIRGDIVTLDYFNEYEISDFLGNSADWDSLSRGDSVVLTYNTDIDGIHYIVGLERNGSVLLSVDDGVAGFYNSTLIIIVVCAVLLGIGIITSIATFILGISKPKEQTLAFIDILAQQKLIVLDNPARTAYARRSALWGFLIFGIACVFAIVMGLIEDNTAFWITLAVFFVILIFILVNLYCHIQEQNINNIEFCYGRFDFANLPADENAVIMDIANGIYFKFTESGLRTATNEEIFADKMSAIESMEGGALLFPDLQNNVFGNTQPSDFETNNAENKNAQTSENETREVEAGNTEIIEAETNNSANENAENNKTKVNEDETINAGINETENYKNSNTQTNKNKFNQIEINKNKTSNVKFNYAEIDNIMVDDTQNNNLGADKSKNKDENSNSSENEQTEQEKSLIIPYSELNFIATPVFRKFGDLVSIYVHSRMSTEFMAKTNEQIAKDLAQTSDKDFAEFYSKLDERDRRKFNKGFIKNLKKQNKKVGNDFTFENMQAEIKNSILEDKFFSQNIYFTLDANLYKALMNNNIDVENLDSALAEVRNKREELLNKQKRN